MIQELLNYNTGSDLGPGFFYQFREVIAIEGIILEELSFAVSSFQLFCELSLKNGLNLNFFFRKSKKS